MKYSISFKRSLCILSAAGLLALGFICNIFAQVKSIDEPKLDIQNLFTPSGWMGDGEYGRKYIDFQGACTTDPHSGPTCIRIEYASGPNRWAGIYWQNKPDNWCNWPGDNYSGKGFNKITFWAKGISGREIVEFKAGGISCPNKPYRDSFSATLGRITLSKEWRQYSINIEHADLSSVIGSFCWVASFDYNNQKSIIFFIDDIYFERE